MMSSQSPVNAPTSHFYCGHCKQVKQAQHYLCQIKDRRGVCEPCAEAQAMAQPGLIMSRVCRRCYDRNRRSLPGRRSPVAVPVLGNKRRSCSLYGEDLPGRKKSRRRHMEEHVSPIVRQVADIDWQTDEETDDEEYSQSRNGSKGKPGGVRHSRQHPFSVTGGKVQPTKATKDTRNAYLKYYHEVLEKQPEYLRILENSLPEERRAELWNTVDMEVVEKFAWAIPDERALRVIQSIDIENGRQGVVEVGAGLGYWASLLRKRGVAVDAFDLEEVTNEYGLVRKGGPEVVRDRCNKILFLCYPDDYEESDKSLALECLKNFTGTYVIHVGELLGNTMTPLKVWGRTSDPDFQIRLAKFFHMIVSVPLPSWPVSMDSLTVWKRTNTLLTDEGIYADLPPDERIDLCRAAPKYQHLLQ